MALSQSALSELLEAFRTGDGVDLIRDSVRVALQELIELEATERIGAAPYERTQDRVTERNGHRPRTLTTTAGDVELRIPKLRKGSFFPIILEPRRRIDQALYAVVMEAYVQGISTRSVDDLVEAMGGSGVSKSEVSRICANLDEQVGAFRTRTLDHVEFPYVYLDATLVAGALHAPAGLPALTVPPARRPTVSGWVPAAASRRRCDGREVPSTRTSLLTYPVLMAADILLYRPERVPVGDDQRQHVELTRDLAMRFNATYGPVFTVPEITTPPVAARVMDLAAPTAKMGKTGTDGAGVIGLLDPPDVVRRTIARAVTDSDTGPDAVRRDRLAKPGVTNLIEILEACGGSAAGITTYGALKRAVTDAVVAELEPVQRRYAELAADPAHVADVLARGAERARRLSEPVLAAASAAMGL